MFVLLVGVVVDYVIMVMVFFFWVFYIGWIVVGIIGVIGVVVGVYIVDIIDGDECVWYFGFMSVCFGFGMVVGFVFGGLMGGFFFYVLFFVVVVLNGFNFLMGCFFLLELYKGECWLLCWEVFNLFVLFWWVWGMIVVVVLMVVFFIM